MPLHGDLRTMGLADLLRWADQNKKTGVLEVERNKLCRRVEFRKGWIGACSSSDPASRLGQFLLSRGKIREETLREALSRQSADRKNLGWILLDMGVLSRKELSRLITAKAEETMHGLFEWDDAVFRFNQGATLDPNHIEVSLSVEEVLSTGHHRAEELQKIRATFRSSGVVLRCDPRVAQVPSLQRPMARRVIEAIDGNRSIEEILLHTRAAQFTVLRFLHQLCQKGLVEIVETRERISDQPTLIDTQQATVAPGAAWTASELSQDVDVTVDEDPLMPDMQDIPGMDVQIPDRNYEAQPTEVELQNEIQVATGLIGRGEHDAALELLNASYRANPHHDYLRQLLARAEESYVASARKRGLSFGRVPVLLPAARSTPRDRLRPEDAFLTTVIDGRLDIQSILWITPLREVDVLMALKRMVDQGLIAFETTEAVEAQAG